MTQSKVFSVLLLMSSSKPYSDDKHGEVDNLPRQLPSSVPPSVSHCTHELAHKAKDMAMLYGDILGVIKEGVVVFDEHQIIMEVNPSSLSIWQYLEVELVFEKIEKLIPKSFCPPYKEDAQPFEFEKWYDIESKSKEGTTFPLKIFLLKSLSGRQLRYILIARQENTADAISQNPPQKSSQPWNDLNLAVLRNINHEIRTPMNGVMGIAQLLNDTVLSKKQMEYVSILKHSANELLSTFNNVMDYARSLHGNLVLDESSFNLQDCIYDSFQSVVEEDEANSLKFNLNMHPNLSQIVEGDAGRLRFILVEILTNALQFTPAGSITLLCKVLEEREEELCLNFNITDTGIGLTDEHIKCIFKPFVQLESSLTWKTGGMGLGLYLVSQYVRLMGGHLRVESFVGKGSSFFINLSFKKSSKKNNLHSEAIKSLKGIRALVVDDNDSQLSFMRTCLSHWGMEVVTHNNAEKALKELKLRQKEGPFFNIAIIDVNLPDKSGFRLAEQIKSLPKHNSMPIMLCTSTGLRGDGRICRKLGVEAYMKKPIKEIDLLQSISSVLNMRLDHTSSLLTQHSLREQKKMLHVLIVDDNQVNQIVAKSILEKQGHTAQVTSNGMEAVKAWEDFRFDLILMDIQMPIMDGIEATKCIREKEKSLKSTIPIIAVTAHLSSINKSTCISAGMNGYLSKPINAQSLFDLINELIFTRKDE